MPAPNIGRLAFALATLLLALACRDALAPPELPAGSESLAAPPAYRRWWADVERCSGLVAAFERVEWFVVPGAQWFNYRGGRYDGLWWSHYHWIALAEARVNDSLVVRHEMLHDLLGRADHPPAYFRQACAAVVSCGVGCRT
jgi:hypothetical protein